MILSLFPVNTLKPSRRSSLECPHQLQTHLPKALLSSLCPFTGFSPLQMVISGSVVLDLPPLHPFYGSSLPFLSPSLLSNGILHLLTAASTLCFPLVIDMLRKKNKIMLFLDPVMSSTIQSSSSRFL